jgi:hypothetical protein
VFIPAALNILLIFRDRTDTHYNIHIFVILLTFRDLVLSSNTLIEQGQREF